MDSDTPDLAMLKIILIAEKLIDSSEYDGVILTVAQAAQIVGVSRPTILKWIDSGKLPSVKTAAGYNKISFADLREAARGEE